MRGWLAVAVLAALAVALFTSPAGGGTASATASLRVVDRDPLVIRGVRFEPGERVRLLIVAAKPYEKRVRAGDGGGFVARLRAVSRDRCGSVYIQAIGHRGSRAEAGIFRRSCPAPDPRDGPPPYEPGPPILP